MFERTQTGVGRIKERRNLMYEDLLSWFFNENGIDRDMPPPPAALAYHYIKLMLADVTLQDIMEGSIIERLPNREKEILEEKNEIESAETCGQIVRFMRRGADILNQHILVRRALEFEDEISRK